MVSPALERLAEVSAFLMSERFTDKRVMLSAAVDQWPVSELLQACNMAGKRATGERRTAAGRRSTGVSF